MRNIYVVAIALVLLGLTPLVAADHPTVVSVPRSIPATGGSNGGAQATMVVLTDIDPNFNSFLPGGVPCFNCVTSGLSSTVGLGIPFTWATAGSSMAIELMVDVATFSGTGQFAYSIRQGSRDMKGPVVSHGSINASVYPANWMAYFPSIVMPPAGTYTMDGMFVAGTSSAATVVSAPLITQ